MRKIFGTIICLPVLLLLLPGCTSHHHNDNKTEAFVDSLLQQMTIDEKVGQLTLYTSDYDVTGPTIRQGYKDDIKAGKVGAIFNAFGAAYTRKLQELAVKETRLHIPLLFGYDVIHGHRTIFPIPLGEAASWDLKAMEQSARIAGDEASAEGLHWTFAPMCDVARDPRWGRMAEGAGEDTYLGSLIAEARVKGFQGDSVGALNSVMACVKHFAAYGAVQAGRDYNTVDMSDRLLRETYLPPYKAAVDAGAATAMSSFNELDGVPATGSHYLLTEILRDEWKFKGFVVTDYTSIMEMVPHGVAEDTAAAAALALEAGVDMDMQAGFYQAALSGLVKRGVINQSLVDEAVKRVLRMKVKMGLFKDPYRYCDEKREKETIMKPAYREAARDVARKSVVLLKNENQILPLKSNIKKLALIGPLAHARREMIGSWSAAGDWSKAVTLLEGLKAGMPASTQISYAKGCNINDDSTKYLAQALKVAREADVVVLAVGEEALMTGEAASRAFLDLPGIQQHLVEEVAKVNKNAVVVLMNGRPLTINWINDHIPAVVEGWFLGTESGNALADVLTGKYNPSGKLPVTFPRAVGQIPIYYSAKNTGRPFDANSKYTTKYLDEANTPLYPFGYGLSYSKFTYGDVVLSASTINAGDTLSITCSVKNDGSFDGEEVVQLYIRDVVGSVTRPVKELKGFRKLMLKKGEEQKVTFKITSHDLAFYKRDMTFGAEPGRFDVFIGGNSRDVKQASFNLK